ncbi:hypothetical protein INT45_005439 [Circinella minor]|uniref:Uncharacterized protein n=1 Tax=Circinella minor TaxID=1195481 RepID=A0A8H7VIB3_9FUNG|nr:hypothetical protein INT45_005439 [Circinella minor]
MGEKKIPNQKDASSLSYHKHYKELKNNVRLAAAKSHQEEDLKWILKRPISEVEKTNAGRLLNAIKNDCDEDNNLQNDPVSDSHTYNITATFSGVNNGDTINFPAEQYTPQKRKVDSMDDNNGTVSSNLTSSDNSSSLYVPLTESESSDDEVENTTYYDHLVGRGLIDDELPQNATKVCILILNENKQ